MDTRPLTDDLSVAPQIAVSDMEAIRTAGFRAIIVNRPDREAPDQPDFAEIAAAAREAGLEIRHVPVATGGIADADVEAFDAAVANLPRPILAYCRSGTRSATLWALSQAGRQPPDAILATASRAGYDLDGLSERLAGSDDSGRGG